MKLRLSLNTDTGSFDLDLKEGEAMSIVLHNPLFDDNEFEVLYSYPFTLPATPPNLEALQHANRLDRSPTQTATYMNATLYVEGVPLEHGILELHENPFSPESIGAVFKNSIPLLEEQLERIRINEILPTIAVTGFAPEAVWTFDQTTPAPALFQVGFGGQQFSFNPPAGTAPSAIAEELTNQINATFPGAASWVPGQQQLRISATAINTHGINLSWFTNIALDEAITLGLAQQTAFYNYTQSLLSTPAASHVFPIIRWYGFYKGDEIRLDFHNYVNYHFVGGWLANLPSSDPQWKTTFVPFVKLPHIFQKIADNSNGLLIGYDGYFLNADVQKLIIFNNRSLDALVKDTYPDGDKYLNSFQAAFDLNDHVPEMTAKELLQKFLSGFACWCRLVGKTLTFYKKRDQITAPPLDWTHLAEPGYQGTRIKKRGFKIRYPETEDRHEDSTQLQPTGSGEEEFTLPFHSAHVGVFPVLVGGGLFKTPVVRQAGSSQEGGVGDNSVSFRLLFDRGKQPGSSGVFQYPLASHDFTNYAGSATGTLSLDVGKPGGIYQQNFKGVTELLADGQPVTIPVRLAIHDIVELRRWVNSRRIIKLPEGQMVGIVKSVKFKATSKGIGVSLVEFVQEK